MYKSIVAAVDKLSEKFFVLMTDEVGLQRGYTNYPALDYASLPPANQQRGRRFTHQSDCDSQATIEDQLQQKYLSKEDKRTSSKSLISLHKFYEPGLSQGAGKEGKAEGVCYEHTKTNGFDYVTLTPLKADERSRQHSVQTDNNHQEVGADSDNHWRTPGRYQQTSLFSLDNITDNMPYAQDGRHGQTADDDTDTGAQATGFLVPYPHDRRQRNLSGQEVRFMSMRAMHECDYGLSWIEENKSEVRPTKKQLYAESGPIKEKVRIVYERDASVSCYSEQDYAGNNVFVILSDNISGDARFGDYVIGTVPTMQPEKFYSDRLDLNTREALLQAQQQYDDRLRADNKDIASWWNNQEASVIPTIIASRPRGKDERETMPDYTDSYSNTIDYYESEDQIYYGSVAKRKAKTPIRKARIHMHKHEMRSGLETELQWNELTAQYDRESPARKAGLDTAIVSVHQRDPTASLPSNTSLLAPSSPKTKRRHSDNPRRQARLS